MAALLEELTGTPLRALKRGGRSSGTEQAPAEILLLGRAWSRRRSGTRLASGACRCGSSNDLQGSLRTDGIDLAQIGAAGEPMQGAADIEVGLMFETCLRRRGQRY